MRRRLAILITCCALWASPALAQEDDIDLDAIDTAVALQSDAIAAAIEGRWDDAKTLAERALMQEASITTAQARLVLARAHEALGDLKAAMRQVENFLALPLLERDRTRGKEVRARIESALAKSGSTGSNDWEPGALEEQHQEQERAAPKDARRAERQRQAAAQRATTPLASRQQRAGGIGLLAGGAAPTIVGLWFIGSDARWAAEGVDSGTWAAIGTPLLITGLVLEGVGAVLLATAPNAGKRTARVSATPTLGPTANGFAFGLRGQF